MIGGQLTLNNGRVNQETIVNIYVLNSHSKVIKSLLVEPKSKTNITPLVLGDFNKKTGHINK